MTDAPFLICDGCGTTMTDAEFATERAKRPKMLSCCPERKMRPITREDWDALRHHDAVVRELVEALEAIRDGYGPNHLSKFARDTADAALAKIAPQ